jgi:lipoate-protein ligase B
MGYTISLHSSTAAFSRKERRESISRTTYRSTSVSAATKKRHDILLLIELPAIFTACTKGKDCNANEVFCGRNCNKKVVSYSLYGNNLRYTDGAIANAELMP